MGKCKYYRIVITNTQNSKSQAIYLHSNDDPQTIIKNIQNTYAGTYEISKLTMLDDQDTRIQ